MILLTPIWLNKAKTLNREFVIQVKGTVLERESKNPNINTGDIEILVDDLTILNKARNASRKVVNALNKNINVLSKVMSVV